MSPLGFRGALSIDEGRVIVEQNLQHRKPNRIHPHRILRWIRHAATGLALTAGIAGTAQAGTVSISCDFLSFTSNIGTDRISYVDGTILMTPSATQTQISPARFLSDPVNFAAGTTHVDFNYDLTVTPFLVNSFDYIAGPPASGVNVGDIFRWGTIRFTNGQWWEQADLAFRLTSHSTDDPALDGHVLDGTLRLISVSTIPTFIDPGADARAEADYFFMLERPDLESMRVYDKFRQPPGNPGFSGDFAIDGKIGSLIPTGFVALNGAGFTDPSVQPGLSGSSVPEPGTSTLLGIGLLAAGGIVRKRSAGRTQ
jgi:PEP-CTERM motif